MFDIETILKKGETHDVEFKTSLSETSKGCKNWVSMLNTEYGNGTIYFGITPSGLVKGFADNMDKAQISLQRHIQNKISPSLSPIIISQLIEGKCIIILSGTRNKHIPYYQYNDRVYIREGSVTRELDDKEIDLLRKKRDRDTYSGPWQCDQCGIVYDGISGITKTDYGIKRNYNCSDCGGEFWPL